MTAGGVPGFFGRKKRTRRPVGLEISFVYDVSGSMRSYIRYLESVTTVQNIQLALIANNVGVTQENRFSRASMNNEFLFTPGRDLWVSGTEVGAGTNRWDEVDIGGVLGDDDEDQTGSAYFLATELARRQYRSGIERVMISASDEQAAGGSGTQNTQIGLVMGALTGSSTRQRFVAISGMTLTITPAPVGVPVGYSPFGFVYTTQADGVAIYKQNNGASVRYYNVPVADTTWTSGSFVWNLTGPINDTGGPGPSGLFQKTNTPRMAYETGGAVYSINDLISGNNDPLGLQAFSISLGQVLGQFLYERLS